MSIKRTSTLYKVLSIILVLAMIIGLTPVTSFAATKGKNNLVRVIVENNTFTSMEDALSKG